MRWWLISFAWVSCVFVMPEGISAQAFKEQDEEKAEQECDAGGAPLPKLAPTLRNDEPNLALLENARAEASSLLPGWCPQRHCVEYLNDGFYNNCRSWILASLPAWAQIDIGQPATVSRVIFGSEHEAFFADRAVTAFQILVADTVADPDSNAATWKKVLEHNDPANPVRDTTEFTFESSPARWVRLLITMQAQGEAQIDEVEIYGGRNPLAVHPVEKHVVTWARLKR